VCENEHLDDRATVMETYTLRKLIHVSLYEKKKEKKRKVILLSVLKFGAWVLNKPNHKQSIFMLNPKFFTNNKTNYTLLTPYLRNTHFKNFPSPNPRTPLLTGCGVLPSISSFTLPEIGSMGGEKDDDDDDDGKG
jgi:hypothetical protein